MKDICEECGNTYDYNEWVRCPHCARRKYKEKKGELPFLRRIQYWIQT